MQYQYYVVRASTPRAVVRQFRYRIYLFARGGLASLLAASAHPPPPRSLFLARGQHAFCSSSSSPRGVSFRERQTNHTSHCCCWVRIESRGVYLLIHAASCRSVPIPLFVVSCESVPFRPDWFDYSSIVHSTAHTLHKPPRLRVPDTLLARARYPTRHIVTSPGNQSEGEGGQGRSSVVALALAPFLFLGQREEVSPLLKNNNHQSKVVPSSAVQ